MKQKQSKFFIRTSGRRLYDISEALSEQVGTSGIISGLLSLYIPHSSASLLIQENYDPEVLRDLERFFDRLVPQGDPLFHHTSEGPDDMPAHVRSALTAVSLSIPILDAQLALGTWQGVFLYEHRTSQHSRSILCHMIGE